MIAGEEGATEEGWGDATGEAAMWRGKEQGRLVGMRRSAAGDQHQRGGQRVM